MGRVPTWWSPVSPENAKGPDTNWFSIYDAVAFYVVTNRYLRELFEIMENFVSLKKERSHNKPKCNNIKYHKTANIQYCADRIGLVCEVKSSSEKKKEQRY